MINCCVYGVPPATIFHLDHIVVVLRRSPASVEHHQHHHAVVLTELIPEALLDRSPGCVIELYVCQELGGVGVTVLGSVGPGRRTTTSSMLRQRFRFGLRGYVYTLSPSFLCISMDRSLRVRRIFLFSMQRFSTVVSETGFMRRCYMHD